MKRAAAICLAAGVGALLPAASASAPVGMNGRWNPPAILSATIDKQRRLVVKYTAADGIPYGESLYLGSDPLNATPVSTSDTGTLMHCNNKSTCEGRWHRDTKTTSTGPFTWTTESLAKARFRAGAWYVQVETTNNDPYASTRYWLWSNIAKVTIPKDKPKPKRKKGKKKP